jgi:hypothetical protein
MPNGAAALKALKKAQDVTYVAPSAWPPGILEHSEHRRGMGRRWDIDRGRDRRRRGVPGGGVISL